MNLWQDESGAVLSAELTVLLAIVVAGVAVGATTLRDSLVAEFGDISRGIRSLDQSAFIEAVQPQRKAPVVVHAETAIVVCASFGERERARSDFDLGLAGVPLRSQRVCD